MTQTAEAVIAAAEAEAAEAEKAGVKVEEIERLAITLDEAGGPLVTKNVIAPDLAGWRSGEKSLFLAPPLVRSMAQVLISARDRHFHLREARLAILMQTGQTANADGLVELGKASKASPLIQVLAVRAADEGLDFIIRLNAEQWHDAETIDRARLLDHQLCHCGVTITGKYMKLSGLATLAAVLGADHIETCDRVQDDKGRVLVRFRKRTGDAKPGGDGWGDQPYAWRIRKHTYEDFRELMAEYGLEQQAAAEIKQLCDELERPDDGQRDLPLGEG